MINMLRDSRDKQMVNASKEMEFILKNAKEMVGSKPCSTNKEFL